MNDKWESSVTLGEEERVAEQKLQKGCIQEVRVASGQSTKQHWVNTNEEYVSEQRLSRAHVLSGASVLPQ